MNITIDAATASIITAIIVSLVSTITTVIVNNHSFRNQQAQWDREEKKKIKELETAEKLKYLEIKEANEKLLQEIYGNAIASLTTLLIYTDGGSRTRPDYAPNLAEAQKWLSLVVAHHYDKSGEEYSSFLDLYLRAKDTYHGYQAVADLRDLMINLVSKDPRVHN